MNEGHMRWIAGIFATILVFLIVYFGSAFFSLKALVEAARSGNAEEVYNRTNVDRLKRSLVDQIVVAYLRRIGETRPIKPMERLLANTYGASVADAVVGKLLTRENLAEILQNGKVSDGGTTFEIPKFSRLDLSNIGDLIGRISVVKPVELFQKLGDGEMQGGVSIHFEGDQWRLSRVELPPKVTQQLAAALPIK
jgi:hypothetical protein